MNVNKHNSAEHAIHDNKDCSGIHVESLSYHDGNKINGLNYKKLLFSR